MSTTTASTYRNLLLERHGAITTLVVNRPEVLNALNRETLVEIEAASLAFASDPEQGALIVTGAGEKSFISGADIQELAPLDPRGAEEISRLGQRVVGSLERASKPVIAAINGYAFGGGCELALACHMRIASENAVMGLPEVGLGIIPGYGGTQRLPRLVGTGRALELILSGRRVKADEAERIGLVNEVVPPGRALQRAQALAREIAALPQGAIRSDKESVIRGIGHTLEERLQIEAEMVISMFMRRDSHTIGAKAFKAGNLKPEWPHHGL